MLVGLLAGGTVGYFLMTKKSQERVSQNLPPIEQPASPLAQQVLLALPTTCVDEPEGVPVITSIVPFAGAVGTKIEIKGCNFAGFEGDKNLWIENDKGVKGILYGERDGDAKSIKATLTSSICQSDNSYRGKDCRVILVLTPGPYKIYTMPWGKNSNEASFMVTASEKVSSVDLRNVADVSWGIPVLPVLPAGKSWQETIVSKIDGKISISRGDPIKVSGRQYVVEFAGSEYDAFVPNTIDQYLGILKKGFGWRASEYMAASGMMHGQDGVVKEKDGQLRVVRLNDSINKFCIDWGEPDQRKDNSRCVYTYEFFISDPINLKDIPGDADRG